MGKRAKWAGKMHSHRETCGGKRKLLDSEVRGPGFKSPFHGYSVLLENMLHISLHLRFLLFKYGILIVPSSPGPMSEFLSLSTAYIWGQINLYCRGCPVYCGMFSSTSGLYPLDAGSSPPPQVGTTKDICRHCQMYSRGCRNTSAKNQWYR